MEAYSGYFQPRYKPKKNDLVCSFRVEPASQRAVEAVAAESSIGTWTEVAAMSPSIKAKGAKVFSMKGKSVKIAYPDILFEPGNIPQILSSVAGNIFNMKEVENLRLEDIEFPESIIRSFKGPAFGIPGIRKLLRIPKRPLCGTIIKPKLGLSWKEHAKVAYQAWSGGLDIVKDDENLTSQSFNRFQERVKETLRLRDLAEKETGEKKIYMANITAETNEMLKRAKFVKSLGGEYAMVDILTIGWSALQTVRDADLDMVLHAHRAMHGALTRNPKHGISMLVLAKIARLIGVDQLHIGTAVGKMYETKEEIKEIHKAIEGKWLDKKPVFAVCSGGLYPGLVPQLIKILGNDIIVQAGGGVHGHPDGTSAGATAMRQSVEASTRGIPLAEYARTHKELKTALSKWGY